MQKGKESVKVDPETGVDEEGNRGGRDGLGTKVIEQAKELREDLALSLIVNQIKRSE